MGGERERERETEATQLAERNTCHQPRLAGAKVTQELACTLVYLHHLTFQKDTQ